jgi:hypothetical protein
MKDVVIVGALRTAIGCFQGRLRATRLLIWVAWWLKRWWNAVGSQHMKLMR